MSDQNESRVVHRRSTLCPRAMRASLTLVEYEWPPDSQKFHFIEEHLSRYVGIKGFHRKYEELSRRAIENDEKDYLLEIGHINPLESRFRLVALKYSQILKFMRENAKEKYHHFLISLKTRLNQSCKTKSTNFNSINKSEDWAEIYKESLLNCVRFNHGLTEERRQRFFSFDLISHVIHYPQEKQEIIHINQMNLEQYPISLIPGQYQNNLPAISDDDKNLLLTRKIEAEYTPETRKRRGRKRITDLSFGEEIDNSTVENNENIIIIKKGEILTCDECSGEVGYPEKIIKCSKCDKKYHPFCMDVSRRLINSVNSYKWKCYYCKICEICNTPNSENLLLCDNCDRPYHIDCLDLSEVPLGRWVCAKCGGCASCLRTQAPQSGWVEERIEQDHESKLIQIHCNRCSVKFRKSLYCCVCFEAFFTRMQISASVTCAQCENRAHSECLMLDSNICLICAGLVNKRL